MLYEFKLKTESNDLYDITPEIKKAVKDSGIENGMIFVFSPHTTAGITINENIDKDVVHDFLLGLEYAFPSRKEFKHIEGNGAAHIKASIIGFNEHIIVNEHKVLLGVWQSIYFCEFDGPRDRRFFVKIRADK